MDFKKAKSDLSLSVASNDQSWAILVDSVIEMLTVDPVRTKTIFRCLSQGDLDSAIGLAGPNGKGMMAKMACLTMAEATNRAMMKILEEKEQEGNVG